jgi:methyl-accepting chemotaxis protein
MLHGWRLQRRLNRLAHTAGEEMGTPLCQVLYARRRDTLAALELALRMKRAELKAVVGRSADTNQQILQAAEDDRGNIQTIDIHLQQQRAQSEQLAAAITEMSQSIRDVATTPIRPAPGGRGAAGVRQWLQALATTRPRSTAPSGAGCQPGVLARLTGTARRSAGSWR